MIIFLSQMAHMIQYHCNSKNLAKHFIAHNSLQQSRWNSSYGDTAAQKKKQEACKDSEWLVFK